jgi:hypothetical protein
LKTAAKTSRSKPAGVAITQAASVGEEDGEGENSPKPPKGARGVDSDAANFMADHATARPGAVEFASSKNIRGLRYITPDLEKLRHYRAGGKESDLVAYLKSGTIGKAVEKRTGRTVEELLSGCRLVMGDFQFLDSWIILCSDSLVKAEDQFHVRLLLLHAWSLSAMPNQDEETDRALASVADAITQFQTGIELAARQEKLTKHHRDRQDAGRAARGKVKSRNEEEVKRRWEASVAPEYGRCKAISIALTKERHPISPKTVERIVARLGLRQKDRL